MVEPPGGKNTLAKNIKVACDKFNMDTCDKMDLETYVNFDGQAEDLQVYVATMVKEIQNSASSDSEPKEITEKVVIGHNQALNAANTLQKFIKENDKFSLLEHYSVQNIVKKIQENIDLVNKEFSRKYLIF